MADEKIQGFAGLDLGDIKDAVGAVVGSGDDVADAVNFVREHGDDLVDFVRKLPELMSSTASALSDASEDVASAAAFLTGGKGSGDGVQALTELAGDALDVCRRELGSAQGLLDTVAEQFDKLPIPDGGIGEKIGDAAKRFDAVGDQLADVAQQLRKLGGAVDNAGHGLARTATKLDRGGQALAKFGN